MTAYDIVILGSGFAGTLLGLIASKQGLSVAILERGTHPRFAIGESSTPLADFKLTTIADRFGLPWLRPFAKYGTWKATYPEIRCGLKRGFSFFRHQLGKAFTPQPDHGNELLVAASPDEARSDTHWFRADFDANLVKRAIDAGVAYFERFELTTIQQNDAWLLSGTQHESKLEIRADFVVDATGDGQLLGRTLGIDPVPKAELRTRSRALYSHFTGVARWHDVLEAENGTSATRAHTFPCDAAALHQIIDGGWMWILRFDHGVTSAGFSLDPDRHPIHANESAEEEWRRLLASYPSLSRQFAGAQPVRPFTRTGRLQRRMTKAAGPDWAMLPHAAGFLDAWLSPGIAQSLFAVERLGRIFAEDWGSPRRKERMEDYSRRVLDELAWVDQITGTCFACLDRFPVMVPVSMLYFIAAVYCEERERAGKAPPDAAFLLADDRNFRDIAAAACCEALELQPHDARVFAENLAKRLAAYNHCGLCDTSRNNLYPYLGAIS